jgi:Dimethlysulfonioproprionate lyase
LTTVRSAESAWRDLTAGLTSLFGRLAPHVLDARLDATVQPMQQMRVLSCLNAALQLGTGVTRSLCETVDRLRSELQWRQNPNYAGAEFLDGYAYCELIGPRGHLHHSEVALGLLLLGPRITYPEHAHAAAEIYAVVAGQAKWLQGDRIWRGRVPGELIHHASMEPHAMRTSDQPLLAAYLWQDHLADGARLVRASHP